VSKGQVSHDEPATDDADWETENPALGVRRQLSGLRKLCDVQHFRGHSLRPWNRVVIGLSDASCAVQPPRRIVSVGFVIPTPAGGGVTT
jgi:hypothetical protein